MCRKTHPTVVILWDDASIRLFIFSPPSCSPSTTAFSLFLTPLYGSYPPHAEILLFIRSLLFPFHVRPPRLLCPAFLLALRHVSPPALSLLLAMYETSGFLVKALRKMQWGGYRGVMSRRLNFRPPEHVNGGVLLLSFLWFSIKIFRLTTLRWILLFLFLKFSNLCPSFGCLSLLKWFFLVSLYTILNARTSHPEHVASPAFLLYSHIVCQHMKPSCSHSCSLVFPR